ncbi:PAS domain S-box protein [Methanosarcina sp. KYL-1]|uniref:PAS domain S-box protein n=1 Tax=Methanosarcina sp. KYL-1 TaxID=2602068 RepID=UPI002100C9A4|nr:PAS domain S-box protein [Methanosarcina sp. KYL-1]MCQ1536091.1 PAS domain S-box protein [Methanosarcina sp. KYL-1]
MTSNRLSADELEIRVQELTAELEKANQALHAETLERKFAEEALCQSEQRVRMKSETVLSPAREMANLELAEIVDIQAIQSLMDDFYKLTHIPMGLNDLKGNVLLGVGWQDICTRFHRIHVETCKHCLESSMKLSMGVASGKFKVFKCKNNMWDMSTPIMIGDQQVGILFSGQFFFEDEPLDYELFKSQAKLYGFNEEEYLEALEKVPRLSREAVDTGMAFLTKLAHMISQLGYSNIKLARSLAERDTLVDALRKSEGRYRMLFDHSTDAFILSDPRDGGRILSANPAACRMLGWTEEELVGRGRDVMFDPEDPAVSDVLDELMRTGSTKARLTYTRKDGTKFPGEISSTFFTDNNGEPRIVIIIRDITERKRAEHQLSNELARATGLCELYTRSSTLSDRELYDFALNQAVKITDSTIGFFHLVSEDEKEIILVTWNQEALRSCTAGKEGHYPIEKAGNWVDCVRLKRPVVYNDFSSSPHQKGLPAGHATVKRFMSVPVTENGKVRIIFGVGNKVDEYDDRDVMQLQLVANELHKIMKLRRIENEVRESEAFLRDIMENVSDAIFVMDREARMILANTAYYRLMGKFPEEVLNKKVSNFYPPEIARKLAEDDKRVMETGKGTTLEERIFTSHGWLILQTVKAPYYDGQGNIIGLIGVARDITELKKAEDALKKAHDNLEKLVEERTKQLEKAYNRLKESEKGLAEAQRMAHIGNWSWNIATNELFWSDEVYRIFGLNPQEFKVTYDLFLRYVHPDDLDHLINAINEGLKGRPHDVDYRIILADGEERIVHTESEIIFYEGNVPVQAKGIVQDITERKKAEEKIKILANALESSNDAIVTESLEGIITSWNRGAEQIYGYSAEEILGKDVSILEPANLKGEIKQLNEKIIQGELVKHYETLRIKKDETLINTSVTLSPIFDASGELVAISAIARDITERIKAETALAEIDIVRIKEIHHRIKNNLQVISSLLDLQAEKFRDKEVLEAFRESQSRILSMSLIHEELYKGGGTDTVNFSAYLKKLAENLFQTYSLRSKNIRLYMDLEENAFFNTDTAVPLGIIVNELVSNSLKHAFTEKEGDIRIRLCREEKNNEISKSLYSLTISDNGKGIPKNVELGSVESLGLQLVSILVDQLDGNIELKREQGTEFKITFNLAERS